MASGHAPNIVALVFGPENEPLNTALLVAALMSMFLFVARLSLGKKENKLIPDTKLTLRNFVELTISFLVTLGDQVMGKQNRKYLPFLCTLFCFLLAMNLLGLIPGFSVPTDNITMNLGLALTVFVLYNSWGVRSAGFIGYLKHFWGSIWWLGPLLFPVEIISHSVRPVSLSLRLFANMTADHMLLQSFTDLAPWGVPVIFLFLGAFVCFMQAFVFTLLTMIYIRLAVVHEEGH